MIYFILYLFMEILLSVEIASQIGGLNTFLEVVLTVLIGVFIIKNFKYNLASTMQDFSTGGISLNQLKSRNIFPVVGAILLIIPGFLTDFIGILFQFTFFTDFLTKKESNSANFGNKFGADFGEHSKTSFQTSFQNKDFKTSFKKDEKTEFKYDDDIIDVELSIKPNLDK